MASAYQIIDEPKPGRLSRFTVDPMWPLFAFMFGGPFISWAWSLFNSFALGSPSRNREIIAVSLGLLGYFAVLTAMMTSETLRELGPVYIRLALVVVSLFACYYIYLKQSAACEIYQYFDGVLMNGIPGVILAYFVGSKLEQMVMTQVLTGLQQWIS
ncbi:MULTISPECIES: hypothetical protein [unclassified Microbulbifer]|uniref:hypothetical protein n=1 Tax=unclassified Microbulbifer TaxID=2619833 RepID=UPI0027E4D061|nr:MULTISPECIES: hypothetical protein [unclassified Microbulbifer]